MPKKIFSGIYLISLLVSFVGCTTGKSAVSVRSYFEDKPRVDQEARGNAGYLMGSPKVENRNQMKKTRKVYVVEFTKEPEEVEETKTTPIQTYVPPVAPESPQVRQPSMPVIDYRQLETQAPSTPSSSSFVDYTVEKNDTLQKISKKFYNSYSKWPRIYEVNKDVLKNPNRLKPGITLKIPQGQTQPMQEDQSLK